MRSRLLRTAFCMCVMECAVQARTVSSLLHTVDRRADIDESDGGSTTSNGNVNNSRDIDLPLAGAQIQLTDNPDIGHFGSCPSINGDEGADIPADELCAHDCDEDIACAGDEKCCVQGCSRTCQKAVLPPLQFRVTGIAFVCLLLCGWAIACGTAGHDVS
mmetsp:Transcript_46163/g.76321  ORF Transcript_46163/g.76321 Transcript_46163/m.76321 type:complete len:160 (-) Transcript_46163:251-730(-)